MQSDSVDKAFIASVRAGKLFEKLGKLDCYNAQKVKTYSRARWIEEGEKPTRYFCSLLHQRSDENSFSSLFDAQNFEAFNHDDLKDVLVSFYSGLFTKESIDHQVQDDLLLNVTMRIDSKDQSHLENDITLDELTNAVKSLPNFKAPGSDGLTVEFYSSFWNFFGPKLVSVFNYSFAVGLLPESQRESIIRLIHKRDDRRYLKNWRPISLLNADYKLCAKVLAERLRKLLSQIIHTNQSCSVPGRKIISNLILIRDMFDYISDKNCPAILVSLDQEKAFDRVDWDFTFKLLDHFGFGENFVAWIKLLYTNISCRIICNGDLTDRFYPSRGVRQGCPLLPLLYILVAEVLGCNIRASNSIEGFRLPGGPLFKLVQYADDTTCFVHDLFSLQKLLDLTNTYGSGTGAKLNLSKTEVMWLGKYANRADKPLGLNCVNKMKILGVSFGDDADNDNWNKRVLVFKKLTDLWLQRNLSVKGRVVIANTLGLSKFYYIAKVLIPPNPIIMKIKKILINFVWHGKAHLVSQDVCHLPLKQGGLALPDFCKKLTALYLSYLKEFDDDCLVDWNYTFRFFLGQYLRNLIPLPFFRGNLYPAAAVPSPFYANLLKLVKEHYNLITSNELSKLTVKFIYSTVQSRAHIISPGVCVWKRLYPSLNFQKIWPHIFDHFCENKKNELQWLIAHRAVKTAVKLHGWHVFSSPACAYCGLSETVEHLFLFCHRSRKVWFWACNILNRLWKRTFDIQNIVFFFPFLLESTTLVLGSSKPLITAYGYKETYLPLKTFTMMPMQ